MSLGEPIFFWPYREDSVETRIVENENEIVCLFVMMMEIGIKKKIENFQRENGIIIMMMMMILSNSRGRASSSS